MKLLRRAAFLACLGAALPIQPVAAEEAFQVGNWTGEEFRDTAGQFSHCFMYSSYANGISVYFYEYLDGDFGMSLIRSDWKIAARRYPVKVSVDRALSLDAMAEATSEGQNGVFIDLPDTEQVFDALRSGRTLRVETEGATFSFELEGSSAALMALARCTQAHRPQSAPNPFAGSTGSAGNWDQGSAAPGEDADAPRVDLRNMVEELFRDRRLAEFRTLRAERDTESTVSWEGPKEVSGVVQAVTPRKTADVYLADILADKTSTCPGEVASSKSRATLADDSVAITLAVYCRTDEGTMVAIYAAYPAPWGFVFTQTFSDSLADARDANQRLFDVINDRGTGRG